MEDYFSMHWGGEDSFEMIQVHYIQTHLLCGLFLTGSMAQGLGTPALDYFSFVLKPFNFNFD